MKKELSIIITSALILSIPMVTFAQTPVSLEEKVNVDVIQSFVDENGLNALSLDGLDKNMNLKMKEIQYELPSNKDNRMKIISENYQYNITLPREFEDTSIRKNFILYSQNTQSFTNSVEITKPGARISTLVSSENAPKEFNFDIEIKNDGYMKYLKNEDGTDSGAIEVYSNDKLISIIYPLEAKDVNGKLIANNLIIDGDTIKQVIHTDEDVTYPLVIGFGTYERASGFDTYFNSGQWITRSQGISLSLYPQDWWFVKGQQQYVWRMAWDTVYDKFSGGYRWSNTNGMKDQFLCHVEYAQLRKTPWNLEPWRPDVGYLRTVSSACNPD